MAKGVQVRRHVVLILAVVTALSLAASACGKKATTEPQGGGTTSEGETTEPPEPTTPTPEFTTLKDGELSAGSCLDYSPFEFTDPNTGDLTGFDVEMIDAMAAKLGLKVTWVKANFNTIFTALAANKFDAVAAASTITPERQQVVDFTDPYFNSRQSLTVNTDKTPDIKSIDDLTKDDVVGVQRGSTGAKFAQEKLEPKGITLKTFVDSPDSFTDLESGQIQGVLNDEGSSLSQAAKRPGLKVVQAIDTDEHYGFAVSKDNPGLLKAMNFALKELIDDGTYAKIFKKWFPGQPVPPEFGG
jgi:polar amino acid transport system substrate-binding protein